MTGLVLGGTIVGQSVLNVPFETRHKAVLAPNAKLPATRSPYQSRSAAFDAWVEPVGDIMAVKGIDLTGATSGTSQDTFIDIVYQDSTVTYSSSTGTKNVFACALGSVLDPKSSFLNSSFVPYVTAAEPYYIDSVIIAGSYVKVTNAIDTLYTWIVWGDSTTTSAAFTKRTDATTWVSPIGTWRYEIIGPKVSGATGAAGNKIKSSAPATNKLLIKYVLTNTDSVSAGGFVRGINIPLPGGPIAIPAGNIVSCFYTFVPGGAYSTGDCSYAFTGAPAAQTINGFAGEIWGQTSPAVAALTDYQDQQVDPDGWNMGGTYNKRQRHAVYTAAWQNMVMGDLVTAPVIFYKVSSTPEGIDEVANNNFSLLQNQPNPFTNQTTVKYQLKKSAADVAVQIFDVRGVKMYEKTEKNLKPGSYSLTVNDVNFAAGVYFCTLTVDGEKVTNRMIKQ